MTLYIQLIIDKFTCKPRENFTKTTVATVEQHPIFGYNVALSYYGKEHSVGPYKFIGDAIADAFDWCDQRSIRIIEWK